MPAKKKASHSSGSEKLTNNSFANFLADPLISCALIVFALIALLLSILDFAQAIAR